MNETNRGYWNTQVVSRSITIFEKVTWVFMFLVVFAICAVFCIFFSSLSAGRIPAKMVVQAEGRYKFASTRTGNKVLDDLRVQAMTPQQLSAALSKSATKPVACKVGQPTQNLYLIINGKKVPVIKNAGIYTIVDKKKIQPGLCFQTNPGEFYAVSFDYISTVKQGIIRIRDLQTGLFFADLLYVNFGSRGIEFSNSGQLLGVN